MAENGVFDKAPPWPPPMAEKYLSHVVLEGGASSLTQHRLSYTCNSFALLAILHPIQMAYFDNTNNVNFWSAPSAPLISGEPYAYPYLSPTLATDNESATSQLHHVPTDGWGMVRRPGPIVGSPTSLRATASLGERH